MGKEKNMTYMANSQTVAMAKDVIPQFLEETKKPMELQEALLKKLLDDNKDTEYGRQHGFADIHSIEDYQKNVPVITYDNIAPQLERMMNGERNVLTAYNYNHMNETSGTVGVPKVVPLTDEQTKVFERYNYMTMYSILSRELSDDWMENRIFCTSSGNCKTLESGITVGEASAKMADYIKGGKDALDTMLRTIYTSPIEAVNPAPKCDTKYMHCRFALMDRNVCGMVTGFYSVAVLFLQYIATNYELLIDDIEKGTISEDINLPDDVRQSLLKKIDPMPERAAELREIFKNGADIPFVNKVWPKFTFFAGVGGDGFEIYDRTLRERFYDGEIKNLYMGITASEGLWSTTYTFDCFDSILVPGGAFLEFLPVEAGNDFSQIVTMDHLEEGKVYELVITNLCGFYRYRMSDAVIVTGFYNKTPKVQFMYRVNRTINLAEEKTTEKALQVTVENVAKELGFELSDFSVYPNTDVTPNRYDFLIEPRSAVSGISLDTLNECVYRHLIEANPVYKDCVDDNWLEKPDCHFLQPETSILYRDMMVYGGASLNQLKPVRVIMNEKQRKFFFGLIEE